MARLDLSVIVKTVGQQNLKRLNGDLAAVDKTATRTTGKLGGLGSALGGLVTPQTALIAGGVALAGAFSAAARAAIDEQKGVALLTQAIVANDPASKDQIENIEATIKERQKLAFADDLQRESLGSLVSVTGDANKALALQRTAMDLARLKGIDLVTASNILGKVYAGNIGILGRYGIQLEKGATATEAIAEIQRRSAGQAEAYAETTAGAFESAQLAMDDVVEDIGAELLPALTGIALVVRDDIIPAFRTMGEALEVVGGAGEVVEGLINAFNPGAAFAEDFAEEVEKATERVNDLKQAGRTTALAMPNNIRAMVDAMSKGGPVIATEAGKIAGLLPSEIRARDQEIRDAGLNNIASFALGVLDAQDEVKLAQATLTRLQEEEMTRAEEIAYLKGLGSGEQLAAGQDDSRTGVSIAADALALLIENRLNSITGKTYNYGYTIGSELARGMDAAEQRVRDASVRMSSATGSAIRIESEPPDHRSGLYGITTWGENIGNTLAAGMDRSLGTVSGASLALSHALVPSVALSDGSGGTSGRGAVEYHYHAHLTVQGDLEARNVEEAEDALLRVSRFSAVGGQA